MTPVLSVKEIYPERAKKRGYSQEKLFVDIVGGKCDAHNAFENVRALIKLVEATSKCDILTFIHIQLNCQILWVDE